MDQVDRQIIEHLRRDGRQANTEIARSVGVSEATVRNRIQRLVEAGIIQVVARVNLSRLGYRWLAHVGVQCNAPQTEAVASRLASIPEVRFVAFVAGRYDLMISVSFRSEEEFLSFLQKEVWQIPGVRRTETLQDLRVIKRGYDYYDYDAWSTASAFQATVMEERDGA